LINGWALCGVVKCQVVIERERQVWSMRGLIMNMSLYGCMLLSHRKALPEFFLCIFSSLTCLKKPVFSEGDLLQWKVPASLSLFLKSEKIPSLLYV
jgi:hypothetical protein